MRELETWEMVKALTEDTSLEAETTKRTEDKVYKTVSVVDGRICWGGNREFPLYILTDEDFRGKWVIKRKPVDFMTAINSGDDVEIRPIDNDCQQYWSTPKEWLARKFLRLDWVNGLWEIRDRQ